MSSKIRKEFHSPKKVEVARQKYIEGEITSKEYHEIEHKERLRYLRGNIWDDIARKNAKEDIKEYKKEYIKEYYQRPKVKEMVREWTRKYHSKPEVKKRIREYNQRPEVKIKQKEYRQKNRGWINKRVREYNKRPEVKARRKSDLNWVIKERVRSNFKDAMKLYTRTGKIMSSKKYGINYQKILGHLKPFPKEIQDYHIDHIKPISSFNFINKDGSTNLEEVKKAWSPSNLQWLPKEINQWKSNKLIKPLIKEEQEKLLQNLRKGKHY